MNKNRRTHLNKASDLLDQAVSIVEQVHDEESDAYDNLPENLQDSERGELMSEAISLLEDAMGEIMSANDTISQVQNL